MYENSNNLFQLKNIQIMARIQDIQHIRQQIQPYKAVFKYKHRIHKISESSPTIQKSKSQQSQTLFTFDNKNTPQKKRLILPIPHQKKFRNLHFSEKPISLSSSAISCENLIDHTPLKVSVGKIRNNNKNLCLKLPKKHADCQSAQKISNYSKSVKFGASTQVKISSEESQLKFSPKNQQGFNDYFDQLKLKNISLHKIKSAEQQNSYHMPIINKVYSQNNQKIYHRSMAKKIRINNPQNNKKERKIEKFRTIQQIQKQLCRKVHTEKQEHQLTPWDIDDTQAHIFNDRIFP